MLKILSAQQIKTLDQYTITHEPISSWALMERASEQVVKWIIQHIPLQTPVAVFCGLGNNGGDGLAIARMLYQRGYVIKAYIVWHNNKFSEDFQKNLALLENLIPVYSVYKEEQIPQQFHQTLIIDAILGAGINKPPEKITKKIISFLQDRYQNNTILSIDVPSGLYLDTHTPHTDIVKAHFTLSFQLPKLAFFFPENSSYVGEWHILSIGLSQEKIANLDTNYYCIIAKSIAQILKKRAKCSHKGNFGKVLLSVGSYGKMGAALLSAKACLRAGAGLLTVQVPKQGYAILQTALPEAMVWADSHEYFLSNMPDLQGFTTIGIGCGIGIEVCVKDLLASILKYFDKPIVLDADALNIIAQNPELWHFIPANSILTPHFKEFDRLIYPQIATNHEERLKIACNITQKHKIFLVMKGCFSAIVTPEAKVFFNITGNAGMATAGSGDVLMGILAGLLAQGYNSQEACLLGVYLHGLAGDIAVQQNQSQESLTASDLIEHLGLAFQHLKVTENY